MSTFWNFNDVQFQSWELLSLWWCQSSRVLYRLCFRLKKKANTLVMTKPCCSCLLIECLLWRPRREMWFPENDFTLLVTTWTECYLNLHWKMLSHDFCPPVTAQQLPVQSGSHHFQAQRFGLTDSRAVFASSLFLLLIISFLETMSRCKMRLSAQRSLLSLSVYSDTLVLLQCSFGSQPNFFGCYTPCFLQKC